MCPLDFLGSNFTSDNHHECCPPSYQIQFLWNHFNTMPKGWCCWSRWQFTTDQDHSSTSFHCCVKSWPTIQRRQPRNAVYSKSTTWIQKERRKMLCKFFSSMGWTVLCYKSPSRGIHIYSRHQHKHLPHLPCKAFKTAPCQQQHPIPMLSTCTTWTCLDSWGRQGVLCWRDHWLQMAWLQLRQSTSAGHHRYTRGFSHGYGNLQIRVTCHHRSTWIWVVVLGAASTCHKYSWD